MTTEIKLIAIGVLVIALALGGFLAYRAAYASGQTAGKAEVQTLWDADKAAIQKVADAAIAKATKDKEAAIANNEGVTNDLQTQLNSMRDLNRQLGLRLAAANSAAHSGSLSQAADNKKPSSAPADDRVGHLNDVIAAALQECRTNWANYSALIKELQPQIN